MLAGAGRALAANSTVTVSLWDRGPMPMDPPVMGGMMGMGGAPGGRMTMAHMGIKVSTATIRAGAVTFEVKNDSTTMVHEMVVSPIKDDRTPLPYIQAESRVDEDAVGNLGEVSELDPGKSGALRLMLKPGRYILYCNIAGHYALGMWTLLTVT
jgi:uncharacterized cupredoxin-like copper-binding protein